MIKVLLKQAGAQDRELTAHEGQTIISFLANQGIYLDAPCAGRGVCGKCAVKVSGSLSEITANEENFLKNPGEMRMACQAHFTGNATVKLPSAARFSSVKGLGESVPYEINSSLQLQDLPFPDRQDPRPMIKSLKVKSASINALQQLGSIEAQRLDAKALFWKDELIAVYPADQAPESILAAAIDLGTTGLAAAIIDVAKGEVIAQGTSLNPQTSCGGDVISRITMAAESNENLKRLQTLALDGLSKLLSDLAGEKAKNIMLAVISGNTTMIHLLAAVPPSSLAQAPYRPIFTNSIDLSYLAPRLEIGQGGKVLVSPCISAYIGGDVTSGLLAVELKKLPGTVLFIDIGTNGEIALSHKGKLVGTSCAAGPALEGMNILCGQRATPGAVDSFTIDQNYNFKYTTIADTPPSGICGSGLIDLCAGLINAGLIDSTGRMKTPNEFSDDKEWLKELDSGRFTFAGPVFLDQKDIRQVQLAKGAIAAAVEMLLARVNLTEKDLDEIIIAGAFGFHLKAESLKSISLIPKNYEGPVRFVGNSSLAGSARMILNAGALDDLNTLADQTEVLELGFDPEFQQTFVKHLRF